jgi:tRNA A-37 threonylcarbamoyl transferase component Bud32
VNSPATTPAPTGTLVQTDYTGVGPEDAPSIPGYEIEREIGRGGMGVVYKARQVGLNRTVAIKMILDGQYATAGEIRRFRAEGEAIAKLRHPNVVGVYDLGQVGKKPYFVLEYVSGGSLDRRLRDGPLPVPEAVALAAALADGVAAAHAAGIVHRDLKPANILLDADGTPKVADFGIAKTQGADGLTQTGAVVGTPAYMSPEQAAGRVREVGPASDIYALGAILYELLTGSPPFKGESLLSTLDLVRHTPPEPVRRRRRGVPRPLEAVCLKCLEKDPADRYPSAAALADDLRRVAAGGRPTGAVRPAIRRRRAVAAGLAVVLAVAAAVVGLRPRPTPAVPNDGPTGGVHAVLVAVSRYDAPGFTEQWQYAERDAQTLARSLEDLWAVPAANIRLLSARAAADDPTLAPTRANVRAAIGRLRQTTRPDSTVLVFLSGSGVQGKPPGPPPGRPLRGPGGFPGLFHFVPADGDPDRPDTLLSENELTAELAAVPARVRLVLADACRTPRPFPPNAVRPGPPVPDVAVFFGGRPGEPTQEDAVLRHGVFARAVINALEDGADADGNGRLTLDELARFVTDDVRLAVDRLRLPPQHPDLIGRVPPETVLLTRPAGR